MNKGINLSKGEWLFFLGTDDSFFDENVLDNVAEFLTEEIQLCIGNCKYKDLLFVSKWNSIIWLKNTLHHQSLFYHRSLFNNSFYDLKFKILADYSFNLSLFKKKIKTKKINLLIALCGDKGISKDYTKLLYREEFLLKEEQSSIIFKPFFYLLTKIKFFIKNPLQNQKKWEIVKKNYEKKHN